MWMLPGTFWHFDLYKEIIHSIKPAIFYDGVNNCPWNGGRSNIVSNTWNDAVIEEYYQYLLDNPDRACKKILIVYKFFSKIPSAFL